MSISLPCLQCTNYEDSISLVAQQSAAVRKRAQAYYYRFVSSYQHLHLPLHQYKYAGRDMITHNTIRTTRSASTTISRLFSMLLQD